MKILDYAVQATNEYIEQMPKALRKKYGQFFTSKETAVFMAGLFTIPDTSEISVLDPGAGTGILSLALLERLQPIESLQKIELVCYENDTNVLELLKNNLTWACQHSSKEIHYRIISENYILSQVLDYNFKLEENQSLFKFDLVIGNPPYKKIAKDAREAMAMPDVCYGAPNLYFLFASMSLFNLKKNGEMVYIIPRSWTSGAYFKRFRKHFLNEGILEHIHLFASRDKVFEKENVLQETIIIKVAKTKRKPQSVTITTTKNNADFSRKTIFKAPYSSVVRGGDSYIYLVTNAEEVEILDKLNRWSDTLPKIGLKMKTGLTVDFRHYESLRSIFEEKAVPLFYSQHIQHGGVHFPVGKEHEYIVTQKNSLLQKNSNYLFVKRFTAKEEPRRLQCGVYLAKNYPEYKEISTQNKINFICGTKALSECVVYGLYVLFNSSLYDSYYRILNGSTQVNATEINSMPVPPMKIIEKLGKTIMKKKDLSEVACDTILRSCI